VIGTRRLLEAWEPPEYAGNPLACLATSFTFDPDFFEIQCLGRFLNLSWQRDEGEPNERLASLIEQHGRLAETPATVIVDRGDDPAKRSLVWDLLRVRVPGGLLHAKTAVLIWEDYVRFIIGSANLTPAGYREKIEAAVILDASSRSRLPRAVALQTLASIRALVGRTAADAGDEGPQQRALATLALARRMIDRFGLPVQRARTEPVLTVNHAEPGRPALAMLREVWSGGPPRRATVLSPFHDAESTPGGAASTLASELAQRGPVKLRFVLPADTRQAATVVRAPKGLADGVPIRFGPEFYLLAVDPQEPRRLHAKVIVLESDGWVAALVGSSNFTRAGLGLNRGSGHLEINVAIGAPVGSQAAKTLRGLIPLGERIDPDDVEWEPEPDDDELAEKGLPDGFGQATYITGEHPQLRLTFEPKLGLPDRWQIFDPTDRAILDAAGWESAGRTSPHDSGWPSEPPVFLAVRWMDEDSEHKAAWPVNADKPSQLPLPPELRLSLEDLIVALRSSRPLPEAIAQLLSRRDRLDPELNPDPLQRFAATGQLLRRTREISAALEGLRRFLERPAPTIEVLRWRLQGPFSPRRLATGFAEGASRRQSLDGEAPFMLAELALTLRRIDWTVVSSGGVEPKAVRTEVRALLGELRAMVDQLNPQRPLKDYITEAFAEATR
jgi:hypothetical protein